MAVKLLLADKSITIQKVVEMLFSGREYEVLCVSDGETALSEAARAIPDVVLADVDLPRVDGYTFAARLKQTLSLAQTPVILMLSRDDVFDGARAARAGIIDHIAKPFESQELIGKVKKALTAAPPRLAEPSPLSPKTAAPTAASRPAPSTTPGGARQATAAPAQAVPSDIFDIIREAPSQTDFKRAATKAPEESVYEVEPVVEVEEPLSQEVEQALPVGERAVEEMREGLGLGAKSQQQAPPEIVNFESLDMATKAAQEYAPPPRREAEVKASPVQPQAVSEAMLRSIAEEAVAKIAREVLEKVAWEVIPDLAERLIKEEIERLKAGT